jgi:transcriptional regulator with XRE-family HTH domain
MAIVPVQSWLAQTALGWSVADLPRAAKVGQQTVRRFERGETLRPVAVEKIKRTFETASVILIDANDGGPGVRLQR